MEPCCVNTPHRPMKTSSGIGALLPSASPLGRLTRLATVLGAGIVLFSASNSLLAQAPGSDDRRRRGDGSTGDRGERGDRGGFNPQEMQARMLTALRERLEVTDDEEWKLISERIAKVSELRRSSGGAPFGMFGGRGGPPPGGGDRGSSRGPRPGGGSSELAALSTAVRDKLPDAEIKSRLDRVREVRKENESKLAKAQEELRAVLSVRQEAVAVVFGLLP